MVVPSLFWTFDCPPITIFVNFVNTWWLPVLSIHWSKPRIIREKESLFSRGHGFFSVPLVSSPTSYIHLTVSVMFMSSCLEKQRCSIAFYIKHKQFRKTNIYNQEIRYFNCWNRWLFNLLSSDEGSVLTFLVQTVASGRWTWLLLSAVHSLWVVPSQIRPILLLPFHSYIPSLTSSELANKLLLPLFLYS